MKISANMVTIARVVLMPVPGYLLYQGVPELIGAIVAISVLGFTDWLDGKMARAEGPTVLGGLLDPIADKIFLAVCLIPLTDRVIPGWERTAIPIWMLIAMFSRDFLVTSLRTSLSLRGAPMRTSVLAKYKTAIQMTAIGYLLLLIIEELSGLGNRVGRPVAFLAVIVPALYIALKFFRGKKPGPQSITTVALTLLFAVLYLALPINPLAFILMAFVTILVIFSGFSYLVDAMTALRGKPGGAREAGRFVLEGILMPTAFLLPLAFYDDYWTSILIILAMTMELAAGGLGNLLAEKKIAPRFRMIALKSGLQVLFAGGAVTVYLLGFTDEHPVAGILLMGAASTVAVVFALISFIRHRRVYLEQI